MHASLEEPTRGRTRGLHNILLWNCKKNSLFVIIFLRLERADEVVEMPQAKVRFTCHAEKSRLRSRLMNLFNFNIIYLPNIL